MNYNEIWSFEQFQTLALFLTLFKNIVERIEQYCF